MRFTSTLFLAFSALASLVSAQSTITSSSGPATTSSAISGNANPISSPLGGTLKAGALTTITWTPTSGTSVTLVLREGKENNLAEIVTIASGIPNSGSFVWPVPKDLVAGNDYSIQIISGKDSNYSPIFSIDSTVTSSSASSSSSSTKSRSSTSTSSASTAASSSTTSSTTSSSTSSSTSASTTLESTTVTSSNSSTTAHASTNSTAHTSASSTAPAATASNINAGAILASPLSLIFCIIAGIVYLN